MKNEKLYLWTNGDMSVGIFGSSYTIESPFTKNEIVHPDNDEMVNGWIEDMVNAYSPILEGKIFTEWVFIMEKFSDL